MEKSPNDSLPVRWRDVKVDTGLGFSFARAVLLLLSRLTPNRENRDLSHEGQMISTAGKEGGTRERRRQGPKERRREGIIHELAHYTGRRADGGRRDGRFLRACF